MVRFSILKCLCVTGIAAFLVLGAAEWTHARNRPKWPQRNKGQDSTLALVDSSRAVSEAAPARALDYLNRALSHALSHKNLAGEARVYYEIGILQQRQGQLSEARDYFRRCQRLTTSPRGGNAGVYGNASNSSYYVSANAPNAGLWNKATLALAAVLESSGQFKEALDEWNSVATGNPGEKQRTQGRLLSKMGREKEALATLQSLLQSEEAAQNWAEACLTLAELGNHHQRNGDSERAQVEFQKALDLAKAHNLNDAGLAAGKALASSYNSEGDYGNELNTRNELMTYGYFAHDSVAACYQNLAIGNALAQANQPELAAKYVEKGVGNLQLIPVKSILSTPNAGALPSSASEQLEMGANAYRKLAEGFLKQADYDKAIAYYKKYAALQDSLSLVHEHELQEAMAMSKSLGQNEERVQLLEKERALADQSILLLQQDQASKASQIFARNLVIGILVGFLILAVIAGIILVRNTRARRRSDKLLTLQSLTGQMNPHFIFNALNSVNEFIAQNDERAANRYLTSFSKLMRKVMDDSRHNFIPLTEEIDMLQLYLNLEHARFQKQFSYTFEVDDDLHHSEFELPPMIVQPYIENAIWHGLRYRKEGGHLDVRMSREGDLLVITIEDDGIGIAKSRELKTAHQRKQSSLGMKNIATRIQLMNELHGTGMAVSLAEASPGNENPGVRVRITIPQKTGNPKTNPPTAI